MSGNGEKTKRNPNLVRLTGEQKQKLSAQGILDAEGVLVEPTGGTLDLIRKEDARGHETMWAE
ncbi:hypothetical protein HFO60_04450 [Rhizobium leguminosarum]|uniref:hypothetical protein n=1 Tax=Rhizobium leguminosarum TaxID=384 RepID=UPI001C93F52B|nr:hypothetical protein [Rhizobium leguminosarum]MBY5539302.1 hypothetical protein [Rhizobium leguminosarum]